MALSLSHNFIFAQFLLKELTEFTKYVNVFILTRSRLGLLPSIVCLFVTELWFLIDDRFWFLLNIFRTWPFYTMERAAVGL